MKVVESINHEVEQKNERHRKKSLTGSETSFINANPDDGESHCEGRANKASRLKGIATAYDLWTWFASIERLSKNENKRKKSLTG